LERWAKKMFKVHDRQHRAQAKKPWPEKVRIALRIWDDFEPFRRMREEEARRRQAASPDTR
jgi:hypothetical protein